MWPLPSWARADRNNSTKTPARATRRSIRHSSPRRKRSSRRLYQGDPEPFRSGTALPSLRAASGRDLLHARSWRVIMSVSADTAPPKSVVPFLKVKGEGAPYLAGSKCGKCGNRTSLEHIKLATTGKLYNYTVVHRNFPGVPVPFISAIVDLDGGGTLKGNLLEVEPDPAKIKFDMPVKVVFRDAGRKDKEGNSYLAYFFVPANKA